MSRERLEKAEAESTEALRLLAQKHRYFELRAHTAMSKQKQQEQVLCLRMIQLVVLDPAS